jgi:hypothetical protein
MSKVWVTTGVEGGHQISVEVDSDDLAAKLRLAQKTAEFNKVRPGQPVEDLTKITPGPTSYERAATFDLMLEAFNGGAQVKIK